jgi:diaminohydroxyphosphoribosylaminopyrimidine deaminase/5-amino-6-(5-phosphoribosylamino)uracil reductase
MNLAFREARKAIGCTSPNPPVGCVLVRGRKIISKGHHRSAGGPHAEIDAMSKATPRQLRGATAYVTLEPCSTVGRTGSCMEALVRAGVARVVYSATDPNPAHAGRAKRLLKKRGIEVTAGILQAIGDELVRPWAKFITTGMPWVIAKAGVSLDGRLTRPKGEGQWLTSQRSRSDAQKLRGEVDAILVGAGTVRADNPSLTLRDPAALKRGVEQPLRIVFTRSGKVPKLSTLFTDKHKGRTQVRERKGLRVVLADLAKNHGCVSVMIEGGGQLLGDAFRRGLVDEACFYIAPILCGTRGVPLLDVPLPTSTELIDPMITPMGKSGDVRVRGLVAN